MPGGSCGVPRSSELTGTKMEFPVCVVTCETIEDGGFTGMVGAGRLGASGEGLTGAGVGNTTGASGGRLTGAGGMVTTRLAGDGVVA